jgi:hypothetical protein
MQRIWRALVGQRHQPKWIELSADPLFIDKACDADGSYLARALVPCADGNCRMQALDRAQPILPRRPGTPGRCTSDGKRLVGLVDAAREVRIDDDATHKASRIRTWFARGPR